MGEAVAEPFGYRIKRKHDDKHGGNVPKIAVKHLYLKAAHSKQKKLAESGYEIVIAFACGKAIAQKYIMYNESVRKNRNKVGDKPLKLVP